MMEDSISTDGQSKEMEEWIYRLSSESDTDTKSKGLPKERIPVPNVRKRSKIRKALKEFRKTFLSCFRPGRRDRVQNSSLFTNFSATRTGSLPSLPEERVNFRAHIRSRSRSGSRPNSAYQSVRNCSYDAEYGDGNWSDYGTSDYMPIDVLKTTRRSKSLWEYTIDDQPPSNRGHSRTTSYPEDSFYQTYYADGVGADDTIIIDGEELLNAVRTGNQLSLETCLEKINNTDRLFKLLHYREGRKRSVVYYAIRNDGIDLIKMLLDDLSGEQVFKLLRSPDVMQGIPFHIAVRNNNIGLVKYLMEKVPEANRFELISTSNENGNALYKATAPSSLKMAKLLLKYVPQESLFKVLTQGQKQCLLHLVVDKQNLGLLVYIKRQLPPHRWVELLRFVDNDGSTLLHNVILKNNTNMLKKVLDGVARNFVFELLQMKNVYMQTPLKLVSRNKNLATQKYLQCKLTKDQWAQLISELKSNNDCHAGDDDISLMQLIEPYFESSLSRDDITKLCDLPDTVKEKVFQVQSKCGATLIHKAVSMQNVAFVDFFLQNIPEKRQGLLVVKCNDGNLTPIHTAAAHGCVEIIEKLTSCLTLNKLCSVMCQQSRSKERSRNGSCLHIAVKNGHVEMVKYIIQKVKACGPKQLEKLLSVKDSDGKIVWDLDIPRDMISTLFPYFDSYHNPYGLRQHTQNFAYVFFNEFRNNPELYRTGAQEEAQTIFEAWECLGFQTKMVKEWSHEEMYHLLEKEMETRSESVGSFVVNVLTHGGKGSLLDKTEHDYSPITNIVQLFRGLPKGVPKVLVVQACQGHGDPTATAACQDVGHDAHATKYNMPYPHIDIDDADTAIIMSTLNNQVAWRNFFIQVLSEKLVECQRGSNLDKIFKKVGQTMAKTMRKNEEKDVAVAQIPKMEFTLHKCFIVKPVKPLVVDRGCSITSQDSDATDDLYENTADEGNREDNEYECSIYIECNPPEKVQKAEEVSHEMVTAEINPIAPGMAAVDKREESCAPKQTGKLYDEENTAIYGNVASYGHENNPNQNEYLKVFTLRKSIENVQLSTSSVIVLSQQCKSLPITLVETRRSSPDLTNFQSFLLLHELKPTSAYSLPLLATGN